jgi:indolepyruvate ferredoxin oxidoreductase alpha subunit
VVKDECIQKIIKRYKPEVRFVNVELCTNCGLCFDQFLCPAIIEKDNTAYIKSALCLGCGICEEICPIDAIKRED